MLSAREVGRRRCDGRSSGGRSVRIGRSDGGLLRVAGADFIGEIDEVGYGNACCRPDLNCGCIKLLRVDHSLRRAPRQGNDARRRGGSAAPPSWSPMPVPSPATLGTLVVVASITSRTTPSTKEVRAAPSWPERPQRLANGLLRCRFTVVTGEVVPAKYAARRAMWAK